MVVVSDILSVKLGYLSDSLIDESSISSVDVTNVEEFEKLLRVLIEEIVLVKKLEETRSDETLEISAEDVTEESGNTDEDG